MGGGEGHAGGGGGSNGVLIGNRRLVCRNEAKSGAPFASFQPITSDGCVRLLTAGC